MLVDLDGTVQNVRLTFFDRATTPESVAFALRDDEDGHFHLRLETAKENAPLRLYHSETHAHEAITLLGTHSSYVNSPANDHWLILYAYTKDNGRAVWVRPVEAVNSPPHRVAASNEAIYLRAAPIGDQLAVGYSNKIELLTLPEATVLASYAVADQTIYPLGFSPDGRFLVMEAINPDGGETLFIQPVDGP